MVAACCHNLRQHLSGISIGIGVSIDVSIDIGVSIDVSIDIGVTVDVSIDIGVTVDVSIDIGITVDVSIDIGITVDVSINVGVSVHVAIDISINVGVSVHVAIDISINIGVSVDVSIGIGAVTFLAVPDAGVTGGSIAGKHADLVIEAVLKHLPITFAEIVRGALGAHTRAVAIDAPLQHIGPAVLRAAPQLVGRHWIVIAARLVA
jgi:hypothetical protein